MRLSETVGETMEIVFENVVKKFGNVTAVNNLNLKINSGEFFVFLGPSGSGKSTALRLVAGLETPEEGNIYIGNQIVNELSPKDRNVAVVFQSYALYPHMTVYGNLAFPLKAHNLGKEEIDEKVHKSSELLGIHHLLDRKPSQLSGGEAQRVALGRAIVRNPSVFLMDEPLSNIDAKLRVMMRAELQKLHQKLKTTMIYVTHDQEEAMTVGQKICVLDNGVLQQVGTPRDIYLRPTNLFVGKFVGNPTMNLFEGSIVEKNGNVTIDTDISTFRISKGLGKVVKKAGSSEVILGVRPEDITISNKKELDYFEAKIDIVELVGREQHVFLSVKGKTLIVITNPYQDLKIKEKVWLKINGDRLYVFDKKSEKSLL